MHIELVYLASAAVLGLVHNQAIGVATTQQYGMAYGLGPRDEKKELTGKAARLQRAFTNFGQTFPIFTAALLCVQASDRYSGLSATGAALYFWARVLYIPLYVAGVPVVRTLVWAAGTLGIVLVLLALIYH